MREISQGKTWTCGECLEKEADRKAALAEAEREEKRKVIQATYDVKLQPVDPHDLTFEQAVYLLALIRAGAYEDFTAIRPLDLFDTPLSPDGALNTEIMKQLYQGRLIDVHPKSLPDAFFPLIDGKIDRFYIYKVAWVWRPTVDDPDKKEPWRLAADIEAIFRSGNWPSDWIDEGQYADLWKKVALQECLVYLKHSMNEHHFDFNTGEKTNQTILSLLDDFSVGQVWNFIWRAAKDAAAYYQRGEVPKRQAANSVVGNIQRSAERAIAEGWEVKSYKRNYDFPVSAVTQVLFITALKIGEDWMAVPLKAWDEGYLRKSDTTQEEST
jgi:hypothetical protein